MLSLAAPAIVPVVLGLFLAMFFKPYYRWWKGVLRNPSLAFVVMLAIIAILDFATPWSEAVVGSLSLCGIALYYIGLSFFKDRLQKQFTFTARKL